MVQEILAEIYNQIKDVEHFEDKSLLVTQLESVISLISKNNVKVTLKNGKESSKKTTTKKRTKNNIINTDIKCFVSDLCLLEDEALKEELALLTVKELKKVGQFLGKELLGTKKVIITQILEIIHLEKQFDILKQA